MKHNRRMYWIIALGVLVGILAASEPTWTRYVPPDHLDFSYDSSWSGRALTPEESTSVSNAISNIRTPPPDSIRYVNAAGSTVTVSCSTLAALLQGQLNNGTMQAETLNEDYAGGEYWDEINISDDVLEDAEATGNTDYLEELLVHEATHKGQPNNLPEAETEIPAYAAELAYKDSNGLDSTDADYRNVRDKLREYRRIYAYDQLKRMLESSWLTRWVIRYLPKDPPENWNLAAFQLGDTQEQLYDLGPLEITDMLTWENYFGNDRSLILIMGANRDGGCHWTGYQFENGQILEPAPWWQMPLPPGFYSMAYSPAMECYFVVDTLTKTIMYVPDFNGDKLPDGPMMMWANSMQFPQIEDMLSVTPTSHPVHGYGLLVNDCDAHYSRWIPAYDVRPFLVDADGVIGAETAFPCARYELVNIQPRIVEPWPWAGDSYCTIFGTWQHPIEVWRTDPTGEIMLQPLGVVFLMDDIQADIELMEPLLAGDFIIAFDPVSGKRLRRPYEVKDPTPREVTIRYDTDSDMITLDWQDVAGASAYRLEVSFDGELWEDPGFVTETSDFSMPLQHVDRMLFRVIAMR
ncbi:MAG: hypothetical protein H6508_02060 [Calditrichaeota bacterium]|nr:hypothetical protein [Calditrichota bacterium]